MKETDDTCIRVYVCARAREEEREGERWRVGKRGEEGRREGGRHESKREGVVE